MRYFHISDSTGGVILERIIAIGPVVPMPYGHRFDVTCDYGVTLIFTAKHEPDASKKDQEFNHGWLVARQEALRSAINHP